VDTQSQSGRSKNRKTMILVDKRLTHYQPENTSTRHRALITTRFVLYCVVK